MTATLDDAVISSLHSPSQMNKDPCSVDPMSITTVLVKVILISMFDTLFNADFICLNVISAFSVFE